MNKKVLLLTFFIVLAGAMVADAQARRAVSGAEATGTFRQKGGDEFKILALGKGKLKVSFAGTYAYKINGELMANTGEASGIASIDGDIAIFKPEGTEDCTITIKFKSNRTIDVSEDGSCGFGMHVSSDGRYRKISSAKPKF